MYFLKNVLEFNHFGLKSKYQNMEQRYRCSSILPEFRGTTSVKKLRQQFFKIRYAERFDVIKKKEEKN
jgi:hypothetical protein